MKKKVYIVATKFGEDPWELLSGEYANPFVAKNIWKNANVKLYSLDKETGELSKVEMTVEEKPLKPESKPTPSGSFLARQDIR